MKCWHPDVFCAALLNAQPMGFYAPAQIVRDARDHGIDVRPVCVNASRWDCTLEPTDREDRFAVRLGMRMVKGLANTEAAAIIAARAKQAFVSVDDLWRRAGVAAASLVRLAEADAFHPSLQLARRDALWAIKALHDEALPLFAAASARESRSTRLRRYGNRTTRSKRSAVPSGRPVLIRDDLGARGIVTCAEAMAARDGR